MNDVQQNMPIKEDIRPDRRHFSRIGAGFLLYNLAGTGFQVTIMTLLRISGWNFLPHVMNLSWILTILCMYLLAFPVTAYYMKTVPKFGSTRHEKWEFTAWLVVFFMGTAIAYVGNLAGNLITEIFNARSSNYEGLMEMIGDANILLTFLAVVIGAPVVEELLFRKFLIDRIIGYGEKFSVLFSGFLFGFMHGNLNQFFYAFGLGCLFAYIYCKTGSIRSTILFHMVINLGGGVIVPLLMRPVGNILAMTGDPSVIAGAVEQMITEPLQLLCLLLLSGYAVAQMLSALVGVILFFVFKKYICFYPGLRRLSGEQLFGAAVFNVGMGGFLVLCLLTFFA